MGTLSDYVCVLEWGLRRNRYWP